MRKRRDLNSSRRERQRGCSHNEQVWSHHRHGQSTVLGFSNESANTSSFNPFHHFEPGGGNARPAASRIRDRTPFSARGQPEPGRNHEEGGGWQTGGNGEGGGGSARRAGDYDQRALPEQAGGHHRRFDTGGLQDDDHAGPVRGPGIGAQSQHAGQHEASTCRSLSAYPSPVA